MNATRDGAPFTLSRQVTLDGVGDISTAIPKLWARTQIGILRLDEGTTEKNKAAIIDLSLRYQVLSDYTAFLALAPTDVSSTQPGPILATNLLEHSQQPNRPLQSVTLNFQGGLWHMRLNNGESLVSVKVVDLFGREVFAWQALRSARVTVWNWDGKNKSGVALQNGRYFLQVKTTKGTFRFSVAL